MSLRMFIWTIMIMASRRSMSRCSVALMPLDTFMSGSSHARSHRMMQHLNLRTHLQHGPDACVLRGLLKSGIFSEGASLLQCHTTLGDR